MSYKVNGLLQWDGSKAIVSISNDQGRALNAASVLVENAAVKNVNKQVYSTPETTYKRTGALRASITRDVGSEEAFIGSGIEYAPYVEFGTRRTKARPFLRIALLLNTRKILGIFADMYKRNKYVN